MISEVKNSVNADLVKLEKITHLSMPSAKSNRKKKRSGAQILAFSFKIMFSNITPALLHFVDKHSEAFSSHKVLTELNKVGEDTAMDVAKFI